MDKYRFGEFIYKRRSELGLTQEELGRKLGVTNKAVSKWEVGETLPDIQLLEKLADTLQLSVEELFACEKMPPKEPSLPLKEAKKNIAFWKGGFIVTGILALGLAVALILVLTPKKDDGPEEIALTKENAADYLFFNPSYRSINEKEILTIYGSVSLREESYYREEIQLTLVYSVQYFYLSTSRQECLISYLNKEVSVTLTDGKTKEYTLTCSPKNELPDFASFKEMNITWEIQKIQGTILPEAGNE